MGFASLPNSRALAVWGSYAYVVNGDGLSVIDISTPALPVIVGFWNAKTDSPVDVAVSGVYAYVAENHGVRVIDVRAPTAPVEVGYVDTSAITRSVAASGAYVYVAWAEDSPSLSDAGLLVIDVTTPSAPIVAGFFTFFGERSDVAVSGGYVFFASDMAGLGIFTAGCGAFMDGFESGDTSAWSATAP